MDSNLLEKFFRGKCSPEEVAALLAWFEKEDLTPSQEQALSRFWQQAEQEKQKPAFTQEAARILAGLNQAIDAQEQELARSPAPRKEENGPPVPTGQWQGVLKAVAAVLLPVCFIWLFTRYFSAEQRVVPRLITMEARPGKRETIRLEDGSQITLHAGSKISYRQPFSARQRAVTLNGEAFFEVAPDKQRPFIVRTGNLTTQALGTSFNVKYRVAEQQIAVALATGSVQIKAEAKGGRRQIAQLKPGQQLVYDRAKQGYQVSAYDARAVFAWRQGVLSFQKATLSQVVAKLESWYGVQIELTGKVSTQARAKLYTGTYANQSLDEVLAGISFVKNFTYEKKGNKVILQFN